MKAGQIPDGEVDTRSIELVRPDDLRGFGQCHFFAGIGGWSYALRLAGWSDDRPVWTGSCPCQPFSSAGAQAGGHDPRDLWPVWFQLLRECRPRVVFGEQVEGAVAHGWFDRLCDDVESEDYAVGACNLPAAGVGAYHKRQRIWFVADTDGQRRTRERLLLRPEEAERHEGAVSEAARRGEVGGVADTAGRNQRRHGGESRDAASARRGETWPADGHAVGSAGDVGFWTACDWLPCRDGKARPVEPGTFPLVDGDPVNLGRLRGYGNAIVPQVAQVFIEAYMSLAHGDEVGRVDARSSW